MGTDKIIQRINALAKKAKETGLTNEETKEQKRLRAEYLQQFRQSFKKQIESVRVIDPEGKDVTPDQVKKMRKDEENKAD